MEESVNDFGTSPTTMWLWSLEEGTTALKVTLWLCATATEVHGGAGPASILGQVGVIGRLGTASPKVTVLCSHGVSLEMPQWAPKCHHRVDRGSEHSRFFRESQHFGLPTAPMLPRCCLGLEAGSPAA